MSLVKVPGTHFVRDTKSMAIINTDNAAKEEYYAKTRILNSQKQEINRLTEEINDIKTDLGDIKSLLTQLIKKQ